ncbi:amidohydrolase [bacterium]|nr:amidohydrolase [bacterium]MBU1064717.1 amidohydrolase [bacterium]MBU1635462.1 amidohydrolase [bacterium]MBU1874936.1 amidohydrolase [bacterium]
MIKINNVFFDEIINARHWLHENPELSYEEYATTKYIREKIQAWNLELKPFSSLKTGGYVDVGTGEKPVLGFRADIDALPIIENAGHSIKSKNLGVMHACGHDFHATIGLGLAKYFAQHPDELNGKLRILFQPAEETYPDGASYIHKEPLFENMIGIFAVHVDLRFKTGGIAIKQGTACASSTLLKLKFIGPGGHTSRPHATVDLIRVTSLYISQLNGYLKTIIDSRDDFTLVFGSIHGGQYHNIIPPEVSLIGTLRNFDNKVLKVLLEGIREFSLNFATLYKCQIEFDIPNSTPAIINDPKMYSALVQFSKENGYGARLVEMEKPSMGADDFAYYLKKVPGLYFQVGAEGSGSSHSSDFILTDDLIEPALDFIVNFVKFLINKPHHN